MQLIVANEFISEYSIACMYDDRAEAAFSEAISKIAQFPNWGSPNVPTRLRTKYGERVRKWRINSLERSIFC